MLLWESLSLLLCTCSFLIPSTWAVLTSGKGVQGAAAKNAQKQLAALLKSSPGCRRVFRRLNTSDPQQFGLQLGLLQSSSANMYILAKLLILMLPYLKRDHRRELWTSCNLWQEDAREIFLDNSRRLHDWRQSHFDMQKLKPQIVSNGLGQVNIVYPEGALQIPREGSMYFLCDFYRATQEALIEAKTSPRASLTLSFSKKGSSPIAVPITTLLALRNFEELNLEEGKKLMYAYLQLLESTYRPRENALSKAIFFPQEDIYGPSLPYKMATLLDREDEFLLFSPVPIRAGYVLVIMHFRFEKGTDNRLVDWFYFDFNLEPDLDWLQERQLRLEMMRVKLASMVPSSRHMFSLRTALRGLEARLGWCQVIAHAKMIMANKLPLEDVPRRYAFSPFVLFFELVTGNILKLDRSFDSQGALFNPVM